jgi:hypothetical protein
MMEDNVAWWIFGVGVGMLLMAMLMQPHKHVDDFTHDIDNYDAINTLLKKPAVEHKDTDFEEEDACPITHWTYFWTQLWARITHHKEKERSALERLIDDGCEVV